MSSVGREMPSLVLHYRAVKQPVIIRPIHYPYSILLPALTKDIAK
jgi:hypothetical protein